MVNSRDDAESRLHINFGPHNNWWRAVDGSFVAVISIWNGTGSLGDFMHDLLQLPMTIIRITQKIHGNCDCAIGANETYAIYITKAIYVIGLSKPLCSEMLCQSLLSTLPQRCQDRPPSPLLAASITFTIQPSVEDIMTGLIIVTTVVTLHCINHMLLHTKVKCQLVPVAGNLATYELFKVMWSGFGVKVHGNTWNRHWNTLQIDTRRPQHCTGAHPCRTNEWQAI